MRSLKRKMKSKIVKELGIKFTPKHLNIEEIKFANDLIYNDSKISHKTKKLNGRWLTLPFPTDFTKEVWAIIFNTTPKKLQDL